jgi:hypothetical protein
MGITGVKMAKYRATWYEAVSAPFKLLWRPHLLSIVVFEVRADFACSQLTKNTIHRPFYSVLALVLT